MKLPNATAARVDYAKIHGYLLSATHPDGQHKARLFGKLGFDAGNWGAFASELLRIARTAEVVDVVLSVYGRKYVIDGVIRGPKATGVARTVWMLERATAAPRLITAYLRDETDEGT